MVILIGGVSQTGKTLMAQKLLERYQFPYLSLDHLKMGLVRGDKNCSFTPTDNDGYIALCLWPIVKGIIMTAIENRQNLIIEGCYLRPEYILELPDDYLKEIISFYIIFSETYIKEYFLSAIIAHRSTIERRDCEEDRSMVQFIEEHKKLKVVCDENHAAYFLIDTDYETEIIKAYAWLDIQIRELTVGEK